MYPFKAYFPKEFSLVIMDEIFNESLKVSLRINAESFRIRIEYYQTTAIYCSETWKFTRHNLYNESCPLCICVETICPYTLECVS